jgi:DNA-binding NarL/FixJ family response regulator
MMNETMRARSEGIAEVDTADIGRGMFLVRDVTETGDLLTIVLERLRRPDASAPLVAATLTRREIEVLRLIATGLRTGAIADRLHVSPATVRNHVQHIFDKLGAHNRLEAVAQARQQRLL